MSSITSIGRRQHGLSFVGWLALVAIFGLLIISFFKIFPIYNENLIIQSVLEGLQKDQKLDVKSRRAIWDSIYKRLSVNEVYSITRENLTVKRKGGQTTVTITYEARQPYLGNLSIVGNFTESIVIDR